MFRNIFSKKEKQTNCFFCGADLSTCKPFTLQYSSKEGLHSTKICEACAETFNEISDVAEEMRD